MVLKSYLIIIVWLVMVLIWNCGKLDLLSLF